MLAVRAGEYLPGEDPVHEYLLDQANLRGFLGAYSGRDNLGAVDESLRLEEIVVGLLQPHAPAEPRILKLVLRIIQSGQLDLQRLHLVARRERALAALTWLVEMVPAQERNQAVEEVARLVRERPPREMRRPRLRYDPERLIRRRR